jgi:hypothetical protein
MDLLLMKGMLLGAIALGYSVAGLFFWRFWNITSDRLFLYFSLGFFLETLGRMLRGLDMFSLEEHEPVIYLIRLIAYGLIIIGIVDKNRKKSPSIAPPSRQTRSKH